MSAKKKIVLKILGNGEIVIASGDLKTEKFMLSEKGFVDPALAFYLVYSGTADVVDESNTKIDFEEFVEKIQSRLKGSVFLVLMDLLKRGKKVLPGHSENELVIVDEKVNVLVLDEDAIVRVDDLYNGVDRAIKQGYKLIIAVVDMYGDVTYYEVSKMSFPKIERGGEFI
ncbi:MAG: hypothetical protein QXT53_03765 [Ignisphaera sp.]